MGKATNTSGKRLRNMRDSGTDEPSTKVQKMMTPMGDWSDGNICVTKLNPAYGIASAKGFSSIHHQKYDIDDIADVIQVQDELELPPPDARIMFHKAFKLALLDILKDIQTSSKKIILVHGLPKIGKSCLAKTLAYYLALESGYAIYIRANYSCLTDCDKAVEGIGDFSMRPDNWTIVDQCNVNVLNQERLFHGVRLAPNMKPLIIFTSGHHVPLANWMPLDHPVISSMVITMRADKEAIDQLKKAYNYNQHEPKTEHLLNLSQKYGLIVECLIKCEHLVVRGKKCNFTKMKEIVYQFTNVSAMDKEYKLLWWLWPYAAGVKSETILEELRDKIEPWRIVALGLHLSQSRDSHGINTVLDWMDVCGNEGPEGQDVQQRSLYSSYRGNSYLYYFPYLDILKPIIVRSFKGCTVQKMYACYLELYNKLEQNVSSNLQGLKGLLFENLIRLVSHCASKPQGVMAFGSVARLVPVKMVCYASTENELCAQITRFLTDESVGTMWCILNVPKKQQFKGYDFAIVDSRVNGDRTMQLFQVTVNADVHSTENMDRVFQSLRGKLKALNVDVTPYFVVPDAGSLVDISQGYQVIAFSLPQTN